MKLYRRLLEFLKPYWKKLVIAMICTSLVSVQNPSLAAMVKYVVDDVLIKKNVMISAVAGESWARPK